MSLAKFLFLVKYEIVYEKLPCQQCAGYVCKEFDKPKCILSVEVENVIKAMKKLL